MKRDLARIADATTRLANGTRMPTRITIEIFGRPVITIRLLTN